MGPKAEFKVEFNDAGCMRIRCGAAYGEYASYEGVATLVLHADTQFETRYIAVTEYGLSDGVLLPEVAYQVLRA